MKAKYTLCGDFYSDFYKTTTGNLKSHLRKRHLDAYERVASHQGVILREVRSTPTTESASQPPTTAGASSITPPADVAGSIPQFSQTTAAPRAAPYPQQQRMNRYGTARKISADQKKKIDRDLLDLFIEGYQPFSIVEERALKKFASWLPGYVLQNRQTISNIMIPALYEQTKEKTKVELNLIRPNDHIKLRIITDLWTSRANESYIAAIGHFITEQYELKFILMQFSIFDAPARTSKKNYYL
ncbi:unnamed protein product [Parnassius apollo]|uniref:(apollo) hypothetical protein n=1 Tax=Parnassius apollo TaxID=110799 RepID=A0A8S3W2D2_PARAO|nr:unnamed protein product [Parnassius apollo]